MSPNGTIGVFIQSDGDVILTVYSEEHKMAQMASAEFCTYSGGGKSSRVREALLNLALAIKLDNDEDPSRRPE